MVNAGFSSFMPERGAIVGGDVYPEDVSKELKDILLGMDPDMARNPEYNKWLEDKILRSENPIKELKEKEKEWDNAGVGVKATTGNMDPGRLAELSKVSNTIEKGNFSSGLDGMGRPANTKINNLALKESGHREPNNVERTSAYKKGDQRGHIIADRFGGPPSPENMVPQSKYVNQSVYKELENRIAK